ncbi:MAG: flavin reductase [Treponema sp.]|nr:flavin reductase [Treponema sp.]
MENKSFYNLSYGVFVLGSKSAEKINACIINTCFQAAVAPVRIAISCINQNLTCQMIKESGVFSLSILDNSSTFETISHFGYQSGRDTDKFKTFEYELDSNGCPFIKKQVCSVFECSVVSSQDLGSHTIFIAEVTDAHVISKNPPLTYAEYQSNIKPEKSTENSSSRKIKGWKCKVCGFIFEGAELPPDFQCPLCGHGAEDFEPVFED